MESGWVVYGPEKWPHLPYTRLSRVKRLTAKKKKKKKIHDFHLINKVIKKRTLVSLSNENIFFAFIKEVRDGFGDSFCTTV